MQNIYLKFHGLNASSYWFDECWCLWNNYQYDVRTLKIYHDFEQKL